MNQYLEAFINQLKFDLNLLLVITSHGYLGNLHVAHNKLFTPYSEVLHDITIYQMKRQGYEIPTEFK